MGRFGLSVNRLARTALLLLVGTIVNCTIPSCQALAPPSLHATTQQHIELAKRAMAFIDSSPDPFHAVQTSIDRLKQAGFTELTGAYKGQLKAGGKYYFTKNKSTLVAFAIGSMYSATNEGGGAFKIIGAHTDSPNLRIKPRSKRKNSVGHLVQLGVECYGGGLWHTWFDRDLGISGRVLVRTASSDDPDGQPTIVQRLVKIERGILRIPNLAIHLQTTKEREAFVVNKEDHLSPILAMEVKSLLSGGGRIDSTTGSSDGTATGNDTTRTNAATAEVEKTGENYNDGWKEHQSPALLQLLARELDVEVADIVDFELCLFDVQPAALGGAFQEFIHSARLDNLASCFMAVEALVEYAREGKMDTNDEISMIVLYDHEEVGSTSSVGAASPIMADAMKRITSALHDDDLDTLDAVIQRSFLLSSDQAHAVHPNYASKHEKAHQPVMNRGMVIKRNANQRYATTTITGAILREVARRAKLEPIQEFIVRQDCGCGSTIGPVISAATGIRAIDVGCPSLSMHSIRETMGTNDIQNGLELFKAFFEQYQQADKSVEQ